MICPECGSDKIIKSGYRYTTFDSIQRWKCKICNHRFILKGNNDILISWLLEMQEKYNCSTRELSKLLLEFEGIDVCHTTIYRWLDNIIKIKVDKEFKHKFLKYFNIKINGSLASHLNKIFTRGYIFNGIDASVYFPTNEVSFDIYKKIDKYFIAFDVEDCEFEDVFVQSELNRIWWIDDNN